MNKHFIGFPSISDATVVSYCCIKPGTALFEASADSSTQYLIILQAHSAMIHPCMLALWIKLNFSTVSVFYLPFLFFNVLKFQKEKSGPHCLKLCI